MKSALLLASLFATTLAHADCSQYSIRLAVKKLNQVNAIFDRKVTSVETLSTSKSTKTYQISTRDSSDTRFVYEVQTSTHRDGSCTISKIEDLGET